MLGSSRSVSPDANDGRASRLRPRDGEAVMCPGVAGRREDEDGAPRVRDGGAVAARDARVDPLRLVAREEKRRVPPRCEGASDGSAEGRPREGGALRRAPGRALREGRATTAASARTERERGPTVEAGARRTLTSGSGSRREASGRRDCPRGAVDELRRLGRPDATGQHREGRERSAAVKTSLASKCDGEPFRRLEHRRQRGDEHGFANAEAGRRDEHDEPGDHRERHPGDAEEQGCVLPARRRRRRGPRRSRP